MAGYCKYSDEPASSGATGLLGFPCTFQLTKF
jgi:hypothetical protein